MNCMLPYFAEISSFAWVPDDKAGGTTFDLRFLVVVLDRSHCSVFLDPGEVGTNVDPE